MAQCGAWAVDPASSSLANISWVSSTRNECVLSPAGARQIAVGEIHQPVVGGGQRAMLRIALSAEMAAPPSARGRNAGGTGYGASLNRRANRALAPPFTASLAL